MQGARFNMSSSPFPGPVPPENNPPINPQYYQPSLFFISAIALGNSTTVTTSVNHNYVIGQLVRLLIPPTYGSFQLNEQQGYVTSIPSANQVVVNINSTQANAFVPSPTYGPTPPQIVAVGDQSSGQISATGNVQIKTYIPGSFINISPN
jgi:hypothetical protein